MNDTESLGLTKQRQAVLTAIRQSDSHLTATEVLDDARRILPSISFATVYNSLHYLRDRGLIGEVRFGNEATRYDKTLSRHDHAVCNSCGKLVDMEVPVPESLTKEAAEMCNFKADSVELILRGTCPECSNT